MSLRIAVITVVTGNAVRFAADKDVVVPVKRGFSCLKTAGFTIGFIMF